MLATAESKETDNNVIDASFTRSDEAPTPVAGAKIEYPIALTKVNDLVVKYGSLAIAGINDKAGFTAVDEARKECKRLKVAVENRRVELKAAALERGRRVDAAAKALAEPLEALEKSLAAKQKFVTDEVERLKYEAEVKARLEREATLKARMDELHECGAYLLPTDVAAMTDDAFAAFRNQKQIEWLDKIEAERGEKQRQADEAERQRIEQERLDADREKLDAERAELETLRREQRERDAEAQRKINEQAALVRFERTKLRIEVLTAIGETDIDPAWFENFSDEEFATFVEATKVELAKTAEAIRLADEAHEKFLADQAEKKAAQEEADKLRAEALKPDREKLLAFVVLLASMEVPAVSNDSRLVRTLVVDRLSRAATDIRAIIETRLK